MTAGQDWLRLGTTLKRTTDTLYATVDEIYRRDGARFSAAWFPVFAALAQRGASTVTALAHHIGQSHAAVSQVATKLSAVGYVHHLPAPDRRRRVLELSPRGRATAARLRDLWDALKEEFATQFGGRQGNLLSATHHLEAALANDALIDTILRQTQRRRAQALQVRPFEPHDADAFRRLNEEWLEALFAIEPIDRALLDDPQGHVLDAGGHILCAQLHGEVIGTCALLREADGVYELSKMAVTEPCRGLGVGKDLLREALRNFAALEGQRLFLESSSKLGPALALYEAAGFVHAPRPGGPSPYARADVYMVYRPA